MTKLTKTQQALLDRATIDGRFGVDHGTERRRPFGGREIEAANGLVALGLAERISSHHSTIARSGRGVIAHVYSHVFRLTQKDA